jgi:hypothetical protein
MTEPKTKAGQKLLTELRDLVEDSAGSPVVRFGFVRSEQLVAEALPAIEREAVAAWLASPEGRETTERALWYLDGQPDGTISYDAHEDAIALCDALLKALEAK